jgi:hypothetical protein
MKASVTYAYEVQRGDHRSGSKWRTHKAHSQDKVQAAVLGATRIPHNRRAVLASPLSRETRATKETSPMI